MKRLITLALACAVAISATTAAARTNMTHPKLIGMVGKNDAFVITLTSKGRAVKTLKAGTYTFVIHDFSSLHNFELDGPHGFSHTFTSVPAITTKTTTLKLKKGKYKYYCVAHESVMFHFFTVK